MRGILRRSEEFDVPFTWAVLRLSENVFYAGPTLGFVHFDHAALDRTLSAAVRACRNLRSGGDAGARPAATPAVCARRFTVVTRPVRRRTPSSATPDAAITTAAARLRPRSGRIPRPGKTLQPLPSSRIMRSLYPRVVQHESSFRRIPAALLRNLLPSESMIHG